MTARLSDDEPAIRTMHSKRKLCTCGGHSQRDRKKNLHHSGTLRRLWYRIARRLRLAALNEETNDGN